WSAEDKLPPEFLVSSTIRQGELLPTKGVAETDPDGRQQVGVRVSEDMPAAVNLGSRADVWVALLDVDGRGFEEPNKLVGNEEVVGIDENSATIAVADTWPVFLM